jgi:uncharacterized protein (DUF1684 family)
VLLLLALLVTAGGDGGGADYRREIENWQKARDARLRAEGGWLTLAGLFWLKSGTNRFGSESRNDIVLPGHSAPGKAGTLILDKGGVTVHVNPGVMGTMAGKPVTTATLRSDANGAEPDVLTMGSLTMQVIERHHRLAIRLKDGRSKTRREFRGMRYYPIRAQYRVVARFVAHDTGAQITVPDVLGLAEPLSSPGYAEFELGGQTHRLDAVIEAPGDTQLFFIFRDRTAGRTTYGSGRFLYAALPVNGRITLDFNKAYSPPCAFTPYATCPLPPDQNRLPIAIEAGELFEPKNH